MVKKILVVEDEEILNRIYSTELKEDGYEAVSALDGKTALEIIARDSVDLVILDLKLPDMSGLQVLDAIRSADARVPVIICSAYDISKTELAGTLGETLSYMVKPIRLDSLRDKIRLLIG